VAELWPGGPVELPHAFIFDGHHLALPEIPTHQLLGWLACGSWWQLLPQSVTFDEIAPLVIRLVDPEDHAFDFEHLWEPAITLFAGLAGTRPLEGGGGVGWWPAVRIASTAVTQWTVFAAWCASHGTDPLDGPLWLVIGRIYAWLRDGRTPDALAKLDQQIWAPPAMATATTSAELPRHVRDEEAALALRALNETLPGVERNVTEWRPDTS
jgi:hypothetical protein